MGHDYVPGPIPAAPEAETIEASGITIAGHAVDPEVTRYRPSVRMARTQSGSSTAQQQAEWMVRISRGESTSLSYQVLDWRANGVLWRPNTKVRVYDPYAGIDDVMLIRSVAYTIGPDGQTPATPTTQIEVVGLTAFDRIDEPTPRHPLRPPGTQRAQASSSPVSEAGAIASTTSYA
jgi:prophage tail gpP-like protein